MTRGEVWMANLGVAERAGPDDRCPALIVQSDAFNRSRIPFVVVVELTYSMRFLDAPGNVLAQRTSTGLPSDAVVNVAQVTTLARSRLTERLGALPSTVMQRVDAGLRLTLGL